MSSYKSLKSADRNLQEEEEEEEEEEERERERHEVSEKPLPLGDAAEKQPVSVEPGARLLVASNEVRDNDKYGEGR